MRVTVERATEQDWQRAFDACPWATFFQSPAWYRHAASLLPRHELMPWSAEIEGTTVVFPFFERATKTGFLRSDVDRRGNAAGVYGGWIGPKALSPEASTALVQRFGKGATSLRLRLNPFHAAPDETRLVRSGFAWEEDYTSVIGLGVPLEGIRAGYASGQRRNLRAAAKAGVTCRRATAPEDWKAYCALYGKTLQRWGEQATSRYKDDFLLGFAGLSPGVALWLAERAGRLGAAILAFQHGGHIVLWHSANDADESEHYPFKLLIHEILADAHARGLHTFDLNPSGAAAGSSQWKSLLGARQLPTPILRMGRNAPEPTKDRNTVRA